MDAKTAKALEDSIAHWKRMRDDPDGWERPCGDHCALCAQFGRDRRCEKCPVCEKTGIWQCELTPFADAERVFLDLHVGRATDDEWKQAAQAEIDFLESLREG